MRAKIITKKISKSELLEIAKQGYGDMVKVVVDISREIMAVGGEFHSDGQEALVEDGSGVQDVWGANIHLDKPETQRIEFSALINVRPLAGNRSMEVQDPKIRERMKDIIDKLMPWTLS